MSGWRVPVRLARREVWRRPGRTLLVALLVAVPVCGMTAAAVLFRTEQLDPAQRFALEAGGVDAFRPLGGGSGLAERPDAGADTGGGPLEPGAPTVVPSRAETFEVRVADVRVRAGGGIRREARVFDVAPSTSRADRLRYRLLEGRTATGSAEVAVTRAVLRSTGSSLGDELTLSMSRYGSVPEVAVEPAGFEIVGVVEDGRCLSCRHLLVAPGAALPVPDDHVMTVQAVALPPGEPLDVDEALALANGGYRVTPAALPEPAADASDGRVRWAVVIGAVALTVAGIVISAAFAVGARRQLTTLGQLSATGATPAVLRRSLALQGTLSGLVGTGVGVALGIAAPVGLRGTVEQRFLDHRLPGWDIRSTDLAIIAAVGLIAATVAALIPARTAARVPALSALAGRRPVTPLPARVPLGGLVAVGVGLGLLSLAVIGARTGQSGDAWALTAIIGGVVQLLGACAVAPALVAWLEPFAARLRGSWRIGARSLARHRTRTGAVVAAVAAAGALAVFGGGIVRGLEARAEGYTWVDHQLPRDVALISQEVAEEVPLPDGARMQGEVLALDPRESWPAACEIDACTVADDGWTVVRLPPACRQHACSAEPDGSVVVLPEECLEAGRGRHPGHTDGSCTVRQGSVLRVSPGLPAPEILDDARGRLGGAQVVPVRIATTADGSPLGISVGSSGATGGPRVDIEDDRVLVADPDLLDALRAPARIGRLLREHPAVLVTTDPALWFQPPGASGAGALVAEWALAEPLTATSSDDEVGALGALSVLSWTWGGGWGGMVLVDPGSLDRLGLVPGDPVAAVLRAGGPLTADQRDLIRDLADGPGPGEPALWAYVHVPAAGPSPFQLQLLLAGVAVLAAVLVIGTSLALAAAESRDEREVLAVAGARPRDLARASGAKAGLMAGLGGTMAVPLGMLPVAVVSVSMASNVPVLAPWPTVAILVAGVPLLAVAVTTAASAAAQRLNPLRVSSATFE